jgi:hypothetical protein
MCFTLRLHMSAAPPQGGLTQALAPMDLLTTLSQVPAVVWSGLLASFVTLSGVMISNASNTKRLLRQLTHDSGEKDKDRINVIRRDVYLKAAEEMAKVNSYFSRIPQLDPSKENIAEGLTDFFSVSAKLQLIANSETSRIAGELTTRCGEILLVLISESMPIHKLNTDIKIADDFHERNQADVNRILADMRQINESGQSNDLRFDALQRSYAQSRELADHFADERDKCWESKISALNSFTVKLIQEMRSIGVLQLEVTAAIRGELGLETDMVAYKLRLEDNWKRMDVQLKAFLDKVGGG